MSEHGACAYLCTAALLLIGPAFGQPGGRCARTAGRNCPGYLLAYELSPSAGTVFGGALSEIWPATTQFQADFEPAPYATPTAVNGKVYARAYGLCDSFSAQNICTTTTYSLSDVQA
jgi:hypothetical protein